MFITSLLLAATAAATPAPKAATANPFAQFAGTWQGKSSSGGTIEERWGEPIGDSMVGTFRMVGTDGKIVFYEILTFDHATGILRIRHFDAALRASEEKDAPMEFTARPSKKDGVLEFPRTDAGAKGEVITYTRTATGLTIALDKPDKPRATFELTKQ